MVLLSLCSICIWDWKECYVHYNQNYSYFHYINHVREDYSYQVLRGLNVTFLLAACLWPIWYYLAYRWLWPFNTFDTQSSLLVLRCPCSSIFLTKFILHINPGLSFFIKLQCLPLNRITLGRHKSDNNNRMIQLIVLC